MRLAVLAALLLFAGVESGRAQETPFTPDDAPRIVDPGEISAEERARMSRRERLELHRQLIEQKLAEASAKQEEAKKEAEAAALQAAGETAGTPVTSSAPPPGSAAPPSAPQSIEAAAREAVVDKVQTVLMTNPLDIRLIQNDRVAVDYYLYNRKELMIDEFTISLDYPPWALTPVAVYAGQISELLDGNLEVYLDDRLGTITLRGKLKRPAMLEGRDKSLATVVWEGARPLRSMHLKYRMGGDWGTAVRLRGLDRLGLGERADDGTIPTNVQVRPHRTRMEVSPTLDGGYVAGLFAPEETGGEVGLYLQTERSTYFTDEEFDVRAMLNNPDFISFDTISVVVAWDPKILEMVDHDTGNRIRRGINANDSIARDRLPFDYWHENEGDNTTGRFFYRAASSRPLNRAEGELFTLRFKALKPAEATSVRFVHPSEVNEENAPATRVTTLKRDLLLRDPLNETVVVRIVKDPRPPEKVEEEEKQEDRRKLSERTAELIAKQEKTIEESRDLEVDFGSVMMIDSEALGEGRPQESR